MKNPFEFGRELGANELVDREAEIAEVVETIRRGLLPHAGWPESFPDGSPTNPHAGG